MHSSPKKPLWKRLMLWIGGGLVLLIAGLVLFVALFDFTGIIQRMAGEGTGREVKLDGKVEIDWGWTTRLTLHKLQVGNMEGAKEPTMASAEKLVVAVSLKQLLRGRIVLPELILENPDIILEKDKDGNANWAFTDNPEGKAVDAVTPDNRAEIPAIGRLQITQGRLRYKDVPGKIDIDSKLQTVEGNLKQKQAIKMNGKGTYQGRPFMIDFQGASVLTLQDTDEPYPLKADLTIGDTHATIDGTVMDPLQLKGLDLDLKLRGKTASDLFDITGIALPPTPPYQLHGQLGLEGKKWKFSNFSGKMGASDLSGSLIWDMTAKRPLFTAKFTSNNLDFADLAGFIGATPDIQADSSAKQKAQKAEAEADPRILPDVPLDISRLSAMDAHVDFQAKRIKATDLPLDDFAMTLLLDRQLLKLKPLKFGTASGDVLANMSINARQEPVQIDGDFAFRRLSLQRLFGGLEKSLGAAKSAGYIGGVATLKGEGKSLRRMLASSNGHIGLGMEGGRLSKLILELMGLDVAESLGFLLGGDEPAKVRCVIADFDVKDGLMASNAIVIDTNKSQVSGKGTVNLKNEQIDMRLRVNPKNPSILSLKTPLTIGGTLKDPAVGVDAGQLAVRGGVASVLGAVFPPAAILAFIERGLGEDSDCAGLVAEVSRSNRKSGQGALIPKNAD